jgi:simple sugar transport system permease protein
MNVAEVRTMHWRGLLESLTITFAAIVVSLIIFGAFIVGYTTLFTAKPVVLADLYYWMFMGSFGTKFSWQDTLTNAAPLLLTALCTAIPARLGLIVIGGEGALVVGGFAAVSVGLGMPHWSMSLFGTAPPVLAVQVGMALAGILAGGLLIAIAGALRNYRGVNETICSLLLAYIAMEVFKFLVEGPMKDPASLNKPSTYPIAGDYSIGTMFGSDIHWGLAFGLIACVLTWILLDHTTFGFACRMIGGNVRSAQGAGLPVGRLILTACVLGGGAAGLAGMVEIAAVHKQANASIMAGYGYAGILVSFIARHHALGIIPAALLFGGINASSGLLQRRLNLPYASVQVFMGIIFVMILLFETLYGRFRFFEPYQADVPQAAEKTPIVPRPAPKEVTAS